MPTENRSSNTEMVSVPRHMLERATDNKHLEKERISIHRHEALFALRGLLAQPAPQPHPEPIAWMVGTAFWWTKEEAERDAAATGKTITPIGPMSGIAPAEQHQGKPVKLPAYKLASQYNSHDWDEGYRDGWGACRDEIAKLGPLYTHADPGEVEQLRTELVEWKDRCQRNNDDAMEWMAKHDTLRAQLANRDSLLRETLELIDDGVGRSDAEWKLIQNLRVVLSASAEPEATS
ncbi:hypothetical protein RK21_02312 [Pseudomonas plecoglossicida]|uniref:hypothetical protein n=1 Tax=Pseudomonas plecoglossicida TaxID=70775 RepID=UPI0005A3549D|nr:hypothetical protein [Pseudomonas plecoglossicida]AJG13820.1 hypothetical protein RK21_02312 [Pseudomonas plecoglossicida]